MNNQPQLSNTSSQTTVSMLSIVLSALELNDRQEKLWHLAVDATFNEYSLSRGADTGLPSKMDVFQATVNRSKSAWSEFYESLTATQRSLITGAMNFHPHSCS
jgi:hypothetical protein